MMLLAGGDTLQGGLASMGYSIDFFAVTYVIFRLIRV